MRIAIGENKLMFSSFTFESDKVEHMHFVMSDETMRTILCIFLEIHNIILKTEFPDDCIYSFTIKRTNYNPCDFVFRVLVLERGRIVEFDAPEKLLSDINSKFYKMLKYPGST